MPVAAFLFLLCIALCENATAVEFEPADVVQCIFVYGPIYEVGRDLGRSDVALFAQKRMGFVAGYLKACQGDPSCKAQADHVFQQADALKKEGVSIEQRLTNAIRTSDQATFDAIIRQARSCDKKLGFTASNDALTFRGATEAESCQTDDELKGSIVTGYFLAELARAEMCSDILGDRSVRDKHNQLRRKFYKELSAALTNAQSPYASTYGANWRERWNSDMAGIKAGVIQRERASTNVNSCKNLKVGYDLTLTSGTWDEFENAVFKSQFAHARSQIPRCQ